MITVITGIPGMGKTSLCLDMMLKERGQRPLFVMGIPDLKVDHFPTPPVEEWTELRQDKDDPSLMLPYFTFPERSVVIIDEAQRVYRPRAAGSKVPPHVAAFETHRHTGVDFWLLTQDAALIDSNIRRLVGRHIHIMPTIMGRRLYEWPTIKDPESKTDRDLAAQRAYKPPRHVFKLYKSAEAHTKQPFRVPKPYYILGGCLIAASYLGVGAWNAIGGKITASEKTVPASAQGGAQPRTVAGQAPLPIKRTYSDDDFVPRNFNRPESAPVYDEIREVKQMPMIAGCIASRSKCVCYDQQGSRVPLVGDEYCRQVSEHPEFNPYLPPDGHLAQPVPSTRSPASPVAAVISPAGAI